LSGFGFIYCDSCEAFEEVIQEPLTAKTIDGRFLCGDLVCNRCKLVITSIGNRIGEKIENNENQLEAQKEKLSEERQKIRSKRLGKWGDAFRS